MAPKKSTRAAAQPKGEKRKHEEVESKDVKPDEDKPGGYCRSSMIRPRLRSRRASSMLV
jgi:hypothetical protein